MKEPKPTEQSPGMNKLLARISAQNQGHTICANPPDLSSMNARRDRRRAELVARDRRIETKSAKSGGASRAAGSKNAVSSRPFMARTGDIPKRWNDERRYVCAVRVKVYADPDTGAPRFSQKWANRAPTKVTHGAANTHPGKRARRGS